MNALLRLCGDPHTRGLAQARLRPEATGAVRSAVTGRLAKVAVDRRYMAAQEAFLLEHCACAMAETRGIAEGFELDPDDLLAFLHLGVLSDLAADGCSVWARRKSDAGAMVAKNRDFRGEHAVLQSVFLHDDPNLPQRFLAVGSLGAPGAYSSGINAAGLAVADTHTSQHSHRPGWLRYFAMSEILAHCTDVAGALGRLEEMRHTGGGCLVLADSGGAMAAVELGVHGIAVERGETWVARTNHFLSPQDDHATHAADPMARSSVDRLARHS